MPERPGMRGRRIGGRALGCSSEPYRSLAGWTGAPWRLNQVAGVSGGSPSLDAFGIRECDRLLNQEAVDGHEPSTSHTRRVRSS